MSLIFAPSTKSGQTRGSFVQLEPETTINYPIQSTEWTILQRLRLHHQRLERKTKYRPLTRSTQDTSSIKWQNTLALLDTHLRLILTRGDLDTIVKHKLKEQEQAAQSQLVSICALLNRLTNSQLLSGITENIDLNKQDSPYSRLLLLVQVLNDTEWSFDLITGQGKVLFVLDSEKDADEANDIARNFDQVFSQVMLPTRVEKVRQPTSEAWESRLGLRDQVVKGFEYLLQHVPEGQSEACHGHRILIKLPDWDTIERPSEPETALELFFSTCASSKEWHQAWCAVPSTAESDDEYSCEFCDDLRDAKTSGTVFRFIARDSNLYISSNHYEQWRARPNCQPTRSLCDLIDTQSFCESRNINPLMPLIKTQRFNEKQRRALASRLALSLSLFLNSDYVLNAYETTAVFFVLENGRCELDLVYATSAANNHKQNAAFNESMSLYNNLARMLLEIEYGFSLKSLELEKLTAWVNDRLILCYEESGSEDDINIKDTEARISYLTAVRDLLNFKRTYRKGSRRFKGILFDIGAIAGEVIFSDVAERLRSCIEPTQMRVSGLESSKEDLLLPNLDNDNMGKRVEKKNVVRLAARAMASKNRASPFQLFDDKDDLAKKADFFFSQLEDFHNSCRERAASIQPISPKPVRIAVLDTGINKTSGAIRGGLRKKRIKHENCRSWVGNDTNDVHDYDGHGTRIAELILRAAPEAEIYICKVFNGRNLLPDEVEGIAKAITYAVDVWKVDIISMSFGLTSESLASDPQLKAAYSKIDTAIENAKSTIFLAAAANHGSHGPRTFPASHDSVICIHASDGNGKDGGISPKPQSSDDNFMILGIALQLGGVRKSGTSYAAPMAASMAAHIIYAAENLLDLTDTAKHRLRTGRGMREMFRLMCGHNCTGGYQFLAPWVELWTTDWHLDEDRVKFIETRILTTEVFKF
ncbi:minor extracellular protease epr [Fusarium mundagurra]|uniref:Minor extracellular protease epr n=1 Tax=Fusarium mundagurra TaxID=1567541 RepID=A0A8H5XZJ3_9HYPO|nr:minor extracellular protease epr [Fusarium mundagurra]